MEFFFLILLNTMRCRFNLHDNCWSISHHLIYFYVLNIFARNTRSVHSIEWFCFALIFKSERTTRKMIQRNKWKKEEISRVRNNLWPLATSQHLLWIAKLLIYDDLKLRRMKRKCNTIYNCNVSHVYFIYFIKQNYVVRQWIEEEWLLL